MSAVRKEEEGIQQKENEVVEKKGRSSNNEDSNKKERKREDKKRKETRRGNRKKNFNNREELTIIHMNIRGIKSKIRDITNIAEDELFDIMVFTETKLKQEETRKIGGYKEERLNRDTEAGGVIIYVKENIKSEVIKMNKKCETIWMKIKGKDKQLIIGGIYSPCENITPKKKITEFVNELEKDLKEIVENEGDEVLIVGDFNAHVGNDEKGIKDNHEKIGKNGEQYRRMVEENNLTIMNNTNKCKGKWTRVQGDKKSILDLTIVTNNLMEKTQIEIDENKYTIESTRAETDHKMTIVKVKFEKKMEKEKWKTITIYKEDKWEEFKGELKKEVMGKKHEEISYKQLTNKIKKASYLVKRKRKMKVRKNSKIMGYNREIKEAIKERRKACEKWKKEKNLERKKEYKIIYDNLRQKTIEKIERTEAEEIQELIEKTGKEKLDFWKMIRRLKKKDRCKEKIENKEKEMITDEHKILEIKRTYFRDLYAKQPQNDEEKQQEKEYWEEIEKAIKDEKENMKNYNEPFKIKEVK